MKEPSRDRRNLRLMNSQDAAGSALNRTLEPAGRRYLFASSAVPAVSRVSASALQVKRNGGERDRTSFHGSYRASYDSRPEITIEFQDAGATTAGLIAIEFSVGEPGHERVVLQVSKPGTYRFPEIVKADAPISFRQTPGIDMKLWIRWPVLMIRSASHE